MFADEMPPETWSGAMLATSEVLEAFREGGSIKKLKKLLRRHGPAYSYVALNAGGLLQLLGAIRAGFKSTCVTEIDKDFKAMIVDFTGQPAKGDTFKLKAKGMHSPAVVGVTTECPNYSHGSTDVRTGKPHGVDGETGWQFVLSVRVVLWMKPLIIEYEMVSNAVYVHEGAEFKFVVKVFCSNKYCMDVATVKMQQYGEILNKERLMMVGNHMCLGAAATEYEIPQGHYSDAVSFCARDIMDEVVDPENMRYNNRDMPIKSRRPPLPGHLQLVARKAPGQGFSDNPHASFGLNGVFPATTTHGTGRHQPEDWKEGDPVGTSIMFSINECAKAQNVAGDYLPYLATFNPDPGFGRKALAMGFGQRFALAMAESHMKTLIQAGVPFDILGTASTRSVDGSISRVQHKTMDEDKWMKWRGRPSTRREFDEEFEALTKKRSADIKAAALQVMVIEQDQLMAYGTQINALYTSSTGGPEFSVLAQRSEILEAVTRLTQRDTCNHRTGYLRAVFDTGAQRVILHEEDVGQYVSTSGNEPQLVIVPAAKGAEFRPSRVGTLAMKMKSAKTTPVVVKVPVITASKHKLQKPLMSYEPFYENEMQLDIRTPKATKHGHGQSQMWQLNSDGSKSDVAIPLTRDDDGHRWWLYYMPMAMDDAEHATMLHAVAEDASQYVTNNSDKAAMYTPMTEYEAALITATVAVEAFVKEVITHRDRTEAKTSTAELPEGKRLDIVFARHPDDHSTRGIKCNMAKSKFKRMTQASFAKHLNHTGCGPHCTICLMASGAMRTIFKIVDKYMETRSGYMFSMDMQIISHRSRRGMKYYVSLRCMGSKYIMGFKLARKSDIMEAFKQWVKELRIDPIYRNYNWNMVTVIKADNDGAWLRKNKKWMPMVEELGIRMFYVSHDSFKDSAEAESTVNIVSVAGKKGMMARNADQADWDYFWDTGRWVLNRTIAISASAQCSPDGDQARPIEVFTHGWFSRARCNQELAYFEMPFTPLMVHDSGVTNASGQPKAVWKVSKEMFMDQIICFDPWTKAERKTKSYDALRLADGISYQSFFNLGPTKITKAERAMSGDFSDNVTVFLPPPRATPTDMKSWKLPSNIEMIKHVLNGDRVPGMVVQRPPDSADGERTDPSVINLWEDAESEKLSSSAPLKDYNVTDDTADNMAQQPDVAKVGTTVDPHEPGSSMYTQHDPKPLKRRSKATATDADKEKIAEQQATDEPVDEDAYIGLPDVYNPPEEIDSELWHRAEMARVRTEAFRVTDNKTQLVTVMNKLDVKPIFHEIYRDWVIYDTGMSYTPENWPEDMRQVMPKGSKFPRPEGVRWEKRVANFWTSKGLDANQVGVMPTGREITSQQVQEEEAWERELTNIGMEIARVFMLAVRERGKDDDIDIRMESEAAMQVDALKAAIRSKDNVAAEPPPKNLAKIWDHPEIDGWLQSLADEITSLTDIGAVSHGHTLSELRAMGITSTPIATQVVFDNKFKPADHAGKTMEEIAAELKIKLMHETAEVMREKIDSALKLVQFMKDGRVTTDVTFDKKKARMVAVGNKQNMTQGVHYHETFAATPSTEESNLLSILVVILQLYRRAFDIKNAFCWAKQPIKLALDYPFGMPQYNKLGEKLYMALLKNTYGKPDGSRLFEEERNGVWMKELNKDGFTCVIPWKARSMFYITLDIAKCTLTGLVEAIHEESERDERLKTLDVIHTWMVVHTDDDNMAGQSNAVMDHIIHISNTAWQVKEVDPMYMLGVQHILNIKDGVWQVEHKMPLYVEGLVATWEQWLILAGWEHASPKTPAPSHEHLTLHDPLFKVSAEESKEILDRGFMNLCGGLVWPIKQVFPECLYAVSNFTTVMSKPSEQAWSYAMHVLAWLRDNRNRGIVFKSDGDAEPMATVDASLDIDLHDGRTRAGHDITMAGGPLTAKCKKLQKVAYSIPGAEYMQMRNAGVDIMWLRILLGEIGLQRWVANPTELYSDSAGAIDWATFGKCTVGNKHLALGYHEINQWVGDGDILPFKVGTEWNKSDIYTKPPTIQMTGKFVRWNAGYEPEPEEFSRQRREQRERWRVKSAQVI